MHPAHFATRPNRAMAKTLNAIGEAAYLDHVVDPDVGCIGNDEPRRLFVNRRPVLLLYEETSLAQKLVDPRVRAPARGLPGSVVAAVIHLADPVIRIDIIGADPMNPHVGGGLGLSRGTGQI